RADQIREIDFAIKWIDIVPVLVDLVISDRHDNVANPHTCFFCRHVWLDIRDINAARFACLPGEFAQLRITRWKEGKPDRRKSAVILALGFLQKMGDDRRRNSVDELRGRMEAQEQPGSLV